MAPSLTPWPSARNKLIVHHVDDIAAEHPGTLYAEYPRTPTTFADGFRRVTYNDLSNAINGFAWWLEQTLGKGSGFPTLTYIGPNDLRFVIQLLGAVKAGYKMLFPTPRYSADALAKLAVQVSAKTMLAPASPLPIVGEVAARCGMAIHQIPEMETLLFGQKYDHYAYNKTFEEARFEPLAVVHTSGTTGQPKPIIWTHEWADSFAAERYLDPPSNYESMDGLLLGTRVFNMMPNFHASNLYGSIFFSIQRGSVMIHPLPGQVVSAATAGDALQYTDVDIVAVPPVYLEQLGNDPELLNTVSRLAPVVTWAGGDVSNTTGEIISSKMKVFTTCGSSEMGLWPLLRLEGDWQPENWHYMRMHPAMNMDFERISEHSGIYEGIIRRNQDTAGSYVQPIFRLFPELHEYRTSDLFIPHPSEPGLWQHYGRSDDLQTLASGEKYHPAIAEQRISNDPHVQEALIVGTMRPRVVLLIRLQKDNLEQGVEPIWSLIEELNKMCSETTQIKKQYIHVINPDKPFPRTAKGTIRRQATAQLYQEELDALFKTDAPGLG